MADLQARYLGLTLKNPLIAGASDLTADLDRIRSIEEAGAGAIVLKSLFEEQIQLERYKLAEDFSRGDARYAEMATIFPKLEHAGPASTSCGCASEGRGEDPGDSRASTASAGRRGWSTRRRSPARGSMRWSSTSSPCPATPTCRAPGSRRSSWRPCAR